MPRWPLITLAALGFILLAALLLSLLPRSSHVGDQTKLERTFSPEEQAVLETRSITRKELATNDGRAGRPAWIAVNGIVHDVTGRWSGGRHHGLQAGKELTERFVASGHGREILQALSVVGRLTER